MTTPIQDDLGAPRRVVGEAATTALRAGPDISAFPCTWESFPPAAAGGPVDAVKGLSGKQLFVRYIIAPWRLEWANAFFSPYLCLR